MKKFFYFSVLAVLTLALVSGCHKKQAPQEQAAPAVPGTPEAQAGPAQGAMAPDFTLPGVDGKTYTLSALKGKVVLVDFWATWCPPCRESIPELMKVAAKYKGKPFVILGVSVDEGPGVMKVIKQVWRENKVNYVFLAGTPQLEDTYQIDSIPSSFLVGKDGRIVQRFYGFSPDIFQILTGDIDQLLK